MSPASTSSLPLPGSRCVVPVAYPFRVYRYDDGLVGGASLKWQLDDRAITDIPARFVSAVPAPGTKVVDTDGDGVLDSVEIQPPGLGGAIPHDTDGDCGCSRPDRPDSHH